jgi:hypothetical protein
MSSLLRVLDDRRERKKEVMEGREEKGREHGMREEKTRQGALIDKQETISQMRAIHRLALFT